MHALRQAGGAGAAIEPLEPRRFLTADLAGLDASFGVGGKVKLDLDGLADNALWVQTLPDGKILISGTSVSAVTIDPPPSAGQSAQPVVQNQARRFLARLTADGALDTTFGENGLVRFPDVGADIDPLAVQPDGKILVGSTVSVGADSAFAVGRLNPDGTIDTAFGQRGVAAVNLFPDDGTGLFERITALALQPDGKVAVAGLVEKPGPQQPGPRLTTLGVARFNADGTVDEVFGRHVEDVPLYARMVVVGTGGQVVVGADAGNYPEAPQTGGFAMLRYNPDGTADGSFGQAGRTFVRLATASDAVDEARMMDLLLQPDGKLAAAGRIGSNYFAVVRVGADGVPDASFGGNGAIYGGGIQTGYYGELTGQYRLRYLAADGALQLAGVGSGIEPTVSASADSPPGKRLTGLQAFSARIARDGTRISIGRVQNVPMTGVESVSAVAIQDDGRIIGVGKAFPTADAGEGPAYAQTADALAVRFDPAALPAASDLISLRFGPGAPAGYGEGLILPPTTAGLGRGADSIQYPVLLSNISFSGRAIVRGGRTYSFRVSYPGETLARQTPVTVTGPNGFASPAAPVKVKVIGRARAATTAGTGAAAAPTPAAARAITTYRVGAPGGVFDAADQGRYAVRLNAVAGRAASGQIVGIFSVNGKQRKAPPAASPLLRLVLTQWTGVLRSPSSLPGGFAGWMLDRDDAEGAGQLSDLDLSKVPGGAVSLLSGRRVKVTGTTRIESRPRGASFTNFVVESLAITT